MIGDMEPRSRLDDLHQLTRVSREFTYARSLDEILNLAVTQAAELLGSEKAVLMLTDDEGQLRVRAAIGVPPDLVERFRQPASEALVSRLRGLLGANLAEGFLGVPLVSQGNIVGLLATVRSDGLAPSEDDEWLLAALADQIAAPLENARLAKQLVSSALLADNIRLYEAEREARLVAEAALRRAESARDAALQADMSKTSFLAAMSHELRTPLNAIGGYVELLEMGLRGPITPEQADDLNRIKASQGHLLRLITEVLDYARLGSGNTELHFDDVDLNQILREAEVMTMPQARARGLDYSYEPPSCRVIVRADSHRLQQVTLNLLTNAIKFTEPGGTIRMTCGLVSDGSTGAKSVRVSVRDTGRGIPADQIDGIWQPFVQVGRRLNQPSEGVGLGLAISRDLARRLGGELSATSELGHGSEFTLTLPVLRIGG
jgi:signal transduction histidine kinase